MFWAFAFIREIAFFEPRMQEGKCFEAEQT